MYTFENKLGYVVFCSIYMIIYINSSTFVLFLNNVL